MEFNSGFKGLMRVPQNDEWLIPGHRWVDGRTDRRTKVGRWDWCFSAFCA